jgi:hypothetical protein
MSFELTTAGITVQTIDEIFAELAADLRTETGQPNLDVSETSPIGQILGVQAEREYRAQLVARDVYSSRFPARATGDALTQGALLTGTVRRDATFSTVGVLVTLTAGTTLPAGSIANVDGDTTALFETLEDVTNPTGITDDFAATMQALTAGPTRALSGTLTVINTPVSGWDAVSNPFDAELGLNAETDPELRLRREEELRSQGATVIAAIVADVDEVEGVVEAVGFENKTDVIVDTLPPHSFEVVVWDGDSDDASDDAIAQAIFDASPTGIASVSHTLAETHTGTAVEPETGDEFTITFSRAEAVDMYIDFDLDVDADVYPVDGDTQVKAAVVAYVNDRLKIGDDVIAAKLYVPVLAAWTESDGTAHEAIAGVNDVTEIRLGATVSPVNTNNVTIGARQIARADTSRVVVAT